MAQLSPVATAVIAALLGGVAGGAVVRLTQRSPPPATSATREAGATSDSSDLEKRIAELERNSSRTERTRRLERAVANAAPAGDDTAPPSPNGGRPTIDDPVFQLAVRDVIEQLEDERREERGARGAERRKQMAAAWSAEMTTALGLSDAQKQKVAQVMQDYYDSLRNSRDGDAGAGTRSEWRDRARTEREKAEGKLGQILDSGQMDKYKALDDDKKLGVGSGGGGRGRRQRE